MGSYAYLEIDGHAIIPMKSYVEPTLMSFFEGCDRRIFERRQSERSESTWGVTEDDDDVDETAFEYRIESSKLKDRLEIYGFSLTAAKSTFRKLIDESLQGLIEREFVTGFWWLDNDEAEEFLREYTFDFWLDQVRVFLASGAERYYDRDQLGTLSTAQRIFADYDTEDYFWGFPLCDPRLIIRGLLEAFPDEVEVVLDYTELVSSGYYEGTEELAAQAKLSASVEFVANSKVVVLTEGSTDAAFLSNSLQILYPHLFPLFSFLDFHEPRLAGGASNLVHVLKGFVGAQIANRVIALFDNDTAAEDALRALCSVDLPPRFMVLKYPNLAIGETYPTIGPQGEVLMNVNGLAGGIELYFGRDVLKDSDGELVRVQWKGYNQVLHQYQGELVEKARLQSSFQHKVDRALAGELNPEFDWSGMKAIWQSIFEACKNQAIKTQQAAT